MGRLSLSAVALAFACGAPPAPLPPATPPTVLRAEPAPPPPEAEPATEEVADTTRRVRVIVVPAGDVTLPPAIPSRPEPYPDAYGPENTSEPGTWPRMEPADPALAWLTDAVRAETDGFVEELRCGGDCADPVAAGCSVASATPQMVSLECQGSAVPGRGAPQRTARARNYEIRERGLERFEVRDALLPSGPLDTLIRASCLRQVNARMQARTDAFSLTAREVCAVAPDDAALAVHRRGVHAVYRCDHDYSQGGTICQTEIAFRELDRQILADSPLGRALAQLEGVTSEEVPLPAGVTIAGEAHSGFAVTAEAPLEQTLARWAALVPAQRAGLTIAADGDDTSLVTEQEAVAIERAAALGGEARAITWRDTLVPFTGRTRTSLVIRDGYDVHMVVPAGTLVTAVRGRIAGRESRIGERNTWVYLLTSPRVSGWGAGNLVEEHEGCIPSPERFLAEVPSTNRSRAAWSLITMMIEIPGRDAQSAVAFAAVLRGPTPRRPARVRVAIYARDASCGVGRRLHRSDLDHRFFGLLMTSTVAVRGHAIVAIATAESYDAEWRLFRLGSTEPMFTTMQPARAEIVVGLREGDAHFPFAVRSPNPADALRVRWTGSTLTDAE
jgi:hypothetical protein